MPTNEERREVAERMRYVAEHGAPEWGTIACCIADCLRADDYPLWLNGDKLFDLLADLIEPEPERTCRIKQHRCTNCDHEINNRAYFTKVELDDGCWTAESHNANYCPNCGARLVKE